VLPVAGERGVRVSSASRIFPAFGLLLLYQKIKLLPAFLTGVFGTFSSFGAATPPGDSLTVPSFVLNVKKWALLRLLHTTLAGVSTVTLPTKKSWPKHLPRVGVG
jgi:hypothetical protein